jgi:exodeoxyribonuclease VII large subunit
MNDSPISLHQLNLLIKDILEGNFMEEMWVVAEIAELRKASSGHCYCELIEKDGDKTLARIRGNIWSFQYQRILSNFFKVTGGNLKAGMEVLCLVHVNFHEVFGLSLNIKNIDPSFTLGAHEKRRKEILERLVKEGLTELNSKLDFPFLPQRIAVISSETAAGYEDFLNQIKHNHYGYRIETKLFHATMQGDSTSGSIREALQQVKEELRLFDLVIILRGGGATLDLAAFDDYELCSAIANFPLPVISGIGHERDHTLVDEVVHTKLKTPTAAAAFIIDHLEQVESLLYGQIDALKYVVQNRIRSLSKSKEKVVYQLTEYSRKYLKRSDQKLSQLGYGLAKGTTSLIKDQKGRLNQFPQGIKKSSSFLFDKKRESIEEEKQSVIRLTLQLISDQKKVMKNHQRSLALVDPQNVLKRGYAIVYNEKEQVIKSSETKESNLTIRFKDGNLKVKNELK